MNIGQKIIYGVLFSFFLFSTTERSMGTGKSKSPEIPQSIDAQLERICEEYKIQNLDNIDKEDRDIYLKSKSGPGIVRGDFDQNGHLDYALLINHCRAIDTGQLIMLIFMQQKSNLFTIKYLDSPIGRKCCLSEVGIQIEKPGKYFDLNSNKEIDVANESIGLGVKNSYFIIYWDGELFKIIGISD